MASSTINDMPRYVSNYQNALDKVQKADASEHEDCLLNLLLTRDEVQRQLSDNRKDASTTVNQITELDRDLYQLVSQSPSRNQLHNWRSTILPESEAWWWYLDQEHPHEQRARWNSMWTGLAVVFFTVGLALLADTTRRFLSAGPDTLITLGVMAQAVIAMLAIGGTFTKSGQELLSRLFGRFSPSKWAPGRSLLALLFLLLTLLVYSQRQYFAERFNEQAQKKQCGIATLSDQGTQGGSQDLEEVCIEDLLTAQQYYERAISLQPEFYEAHYNLGSLYEDMLDYESALAEYQYAMKGDLDLAYNNAARLQILMEKPAEAVALLQNKKAVNDDVQPWILKNLGWAWVELGAYEDALAVLQKAIAFKSDLASAHCLLAITLEELDRKDEAFEQWNECIRLARNSVPEEIKWRLFAQDKVSQDEVD